MKQWTHGTGGTTVAVEVVSSKSIRKARVIVYYPDLAAVSPNARPAIPVLCFMYGGSALKVSSMRRAAIATLTDPG